ncbi:MAG: sensor histidine kinase [Myxococcota bacterium]
MRWGIRTQVLVALAAVLAFGLVASYLVTSRVTRSAVIEGRILQAREAARLVAERFTGVPTEGLAVREVLARVRPMVAPAEVFLLGQDLQPVAGSPRERARFDTLVDPSDLAPLRQSGVSHAVLHLDGRDSPLLAVLSPFEGAPSRMGREAVRPAVVCLLSPLGSTVARVERIEGLYLLFTLIILALALVLGYVLLGRTVVGPVQRLMRFVERVRGGGDPSAAAASAATTGPRPAGELGLLWDAFHRTAEDLSKDRKRIQLQLSELEIANREIEAAQEHLVRTEKLASVGELAAGVAHEIGNPVATLQGYLEMVADPELTREQRAKYLRVMEGSLDRVQTIIRDLLDFARPSDDEEAMCDAVEVARSAATLVEPQKRFRQLDLELDLPDRPVQASIPSGRLEQVLVNLLFNAADASPEGGIIWLRVHARRDDKVEIVVTDEGHGITQTGLNRIFDPFFTSKDPGKGTGLGLAICNSIVDNYDGALQAASTLGRGATFTVVLPRPHTRTRRETLTWGEPSSS